jgi:hypothetical protein
LTPRGQRGRSVLLEYVTAVQVTVEIEMIVNRGVNGGEILKGFDISEPSHRALSSSKRLM